MICRGSITPSRLIGRLSNFRGWHASARPRAKRASASGGATLRPVLGRSVRAVHGAKHLSDTAIPPAKPRRPRRVDRQQALLSETTPRVRGATDSDSRRARTTSLCVTPTSKSPQPPKNDSRPLLCELGVIRNEGGCHRQRSKGVVGVFGTRQSTHDSLAFGSLTVRGTRKFNPQAGRRRR